MRDRFAFFDLGNVLVTFEHRLAVEQLASLTEQSPQRVHQVVFESGLQNRYETGLVDSQEFTRRVQQELGTEQSQSAILEAVSAIFEPNPPITGVLQMIRDADVPMGVLSNTCQAHWEWIQAREWPLPGQWFDVQILSYEVGSMKPAPEIYQAAEQAADCPAEGIFFTDDRPENVAAARQRGWTAHLFESTEKLSTQMWVWLER